MRGFFFLPFRKLPSYCVFTRERERHIPKDLWCLFIFKGANPIPLWGPHPQELIKLNYLPKGSSLYNITLVVSALTQKFQGDTIQSTMAFLKEEYGERHVVSNSSRKPSFLAGACILINVGEKAGGSISKGRILLNTHTFLKSNLYQNPKWTDWGPNQGKRSSSRDENYILF